MKSSLSVSKYALEAAISAIEKINIKALETLKKLGIYFDKNKKYNNINAYAKSGE